MEEDQVVARLRAAGCVFAEEEARLLGEAARTPAGLEAMVGQREKGLPLEQVVGWADFCGLRIFVDPGVFVPRRRSEFLVETAVSLASGASPVIVDEGPREWTVRQIFDDPAGDHDWGISATVDLAASDGAGAAVVHVTDVGEL